jgi:hypothetical protein
MSNQPTKLITSPMFGHNFFKIEKTIIKVFIEMRV